MRLIDADALLERMREYANDDWNLSLGGLFTDAVDTCIDFVENAETIEAAPVVHGEWIYENYTWHCGVCGFHPFKGYIPKEPGFNICPNCMADMRKGGAK